MQKRGVGSEDGTELSEERGEALQGLERCLEDVDYPITREALIEKKGADVCYEAPSGDAWRVRDLLKGVPVDEFSSANHVREVVQIRWQDMADVYRPGGTGPTGPYGPKE